jgi:hypothetical protein
MMKKAIVATNLAQAFVKKSMKFNSYAQRAIAFWMAEPAFPDTPDGKFAAGAAVTYEWAVHTQMLYTGKTRPTVEKWIRASIELNLFVSDSMKDGTPMLVRVGKDRTYTNYLDNHIPGVALMVKVEDLLNASYQHVRAILFHTWCGTKAVVRSRIWQAQYSEFSEQTTRNWSNELGKGLTRISQSYSDGSGNIIKRAPNIYKSDLYQKVATNNPQQAWQEGTTKYFGFIKPDTKYQRRYASSEEEAMCIVNQRIKAMEKNPHLRLSLEVFYPKREFVDGRWLNTQVKAIPYTLEEMIALRELPVDCVVNQISKKKQQFKKTLNELQQIELMLNPELMLLADDYEFPEPVQIIQHKGSSTQQKNINHLQRDILLDSFKKTLRAN